MTTMLPELALDSSPHPHTSPPVSDGSPPLFPLSLAPFERYMLADDDANYPTQFFCRLHFHGRIEQGPLETAFQVALARHPLLTALVRDSGKGRLDWVAAADRLPKINWIHEEPTESLPTAGHLDIRVTPGVQLSVVLGKDRSDLVAQFQHVACDGVAGFDFLGDLLVAYANLTAVGNRCRLKPLDPHLLRQRATFGLTIGKLLKRLPRDVAALLLRAIGFYKRRPVSIIPRIPARSELPSDYPRSRFHRFDREETALIGRVAAASGTSVNSLLTRDLFLALGDWRDRQGLACAEDWLRIVVPTNMREVGDRRMPAANLVSLVFLDRQMAAVRCPDTLLAGIVREMALVKREESALRLPLLLSLLRWFPGLLAQGVRRKRCWATMLLTNMGPALPNCLLPRDAGRLVVGGLTLQNVDVLPLVRRHQPVSFAVSTYAGELTLGMHFDPRTIPADEAGALLSVYVRRIRESMGR